MRQAVKKKASDFNARWQRSSGAADGADVLVCGYRGILSTKFEAKDVRNLTNFFDKRPPLPFDETQQYRIPSCPRLPACSSASLRRERGGGEKAWAAVDEARRRSKSVKISSAVSRFKSWKWRRSRLESNDVEWVVETGKRTDKQKV
jgi:hypothetical protein